MGVFLAISGLKHNARTHALTQARTHAHTQAHIITMHSFAVNNKFYYQVLSTLELRPINIYNRITLGFLIRPLSA